MSHDHSFWTLKNMIFNHSWMIGDHIQSQLFHFFSQFFLIFPHQFWNHIWKHFFRVIFFEVFANFFKKVKKFYKEFDLTCKTYSKKPQYNGKFKLSCDRQSFTIIDRIVSHDHSRSWSLGLKKYEPHSLMIGNDREWSPITFRSPYHWLSPPLRFPSCPLPETPPRSAYFILTFSYLRYLNLLKRPD